MTGEQFLSGLLDYLKEIGKESLISGHGVIKSNPDKSKHLETVTFKLFGYDIDIANLRHEEYTTKSRIPSMVIKNYKLSMSELKIFAIFLEIWNSSSRR